MDQNQILFNKKRRDIKLAQISVFLAGKKDIRGTELARASKLTVLNDIAYILCNKCLYFHFSPKGQGGGGGDIYVGTFLCKNTALLLTLWIKNRSGSVS